MSFTSYNAKDCTIVVNGVYITGLDETMITFEKDEEMFSTQVGAQGDVVMSETNNPLCTLTLSVQATCPQKAMLVSLATTGQLFEIWVTNRSLAERCGGTQARIKSWPSVEYAAESSAREFEIQIFDGVLQSME